QSGNALAANFTWSFTTSATSPTCPCTIWSGATTPAVASRTDSNPVELGVRFRSDLSGSITAIRFYKGPANTGTHTGHLWTNTGTLLASVTFAGETASGWQQATLSTPVAIAANTTYVVSYYAPAGGWAVNLSYFAPTPSRSTPSPFFRMSRSLVTHASSARNRLISVSRGQAQEA